MDINRTYHFENVWGDKPAALGEEIKAFWQKWQALPDGADADSRVAQVIYVVRDPEQQIAGIGSAYYSHVARLNQYFYIYRTFIAPELRRTYAAKDLLLASRKFLEQYNSEQQQQKALGILLEVENQVLKYGGITVKRAVWKDTGFVYIGTSRQGAHMRVYYFDGALIEPNDQ